MKYGSITTMEEANQYIKSKYGQDTGLEEIKVGNKLKYRFVNLWFMNNHIVFPFCKSVESAMNKLFEKESHTGYSVQEEWKPKKKVKRRNTKQSIRDRLKANWLKQAGIKNPQINRKKDTPRIIIYGGFNTCK